MHKRRKYFPHRFGYSSQAFCKRSNKPKLICILQFPSECGILKSQGRELRTKAFSC